MILSFKELQSFPQVLQSLTGISLQEFECLLVSFEEAWETFVKQRFQREGRSSSLGRR
ncbi:hypothetical protein [Moorena sp. SIO4G3]|uniref:hypothetical protein n=1 Tax=Moorena sp. SIO4G3 TaxID=2607821 RepID=UPI0025DEBAE1|nr:hypothetical protein [Moorena sp. SIO4G3]